MDLINELRELANGILLVLISIIAQKWFDNHHR